MLKISAISKYLFRRQVRQNFLNSIALFIAVIFLVGCSSKLFQGNREILEGDRENRDIRIVDPYKGTISVPFELINNLIVISLRINDSEELKFILDTGAGRTIITELGSDQSFRISYQGDVELNGLGNSGSISALISRGNEIFLDGIEGENQTIVVLLEDTFNLSHFMGTQINGLLGYDIFKNFIVEADYERKKIYLHDPDAFEEKYLERKNDESWTYVPLHSQDNKVYADLTITQSNNTKLDARLLIDSGASHTIFLYPEISKNVVIPSNHIETYLGSGLSGEIYGKIGKARKVELKGFEVKEPILAFPDLEAVDLAIDRGSRNGSLGADFLKRFDIIYNYRDESMLIRRNRRFREKFKYNISGLEIITPVLELPFYVVSKVRPNSPADKAGLQKDDIIIKVDYKNVYQYSLSELLDKINTFDKKNIIINVKRNSTFINFKLELEDILKLDYSVP